MERERQSSAKAANVGSAAALRMKRFKERMMRIEEDDGRG